MKTVVDDPDAIDSKCHVPTESGLCKSEATTWVETVGGVRTYLCESHAEDAARFDEDIDGPEPHPLSARCVECGKVTPVDRLTGTSECEDCAG